MRSYCTQNSGDCSSCSLSSYRRDCRNNGIDESEVRRLSDDVYYRLIDLVTIEALRGDPEGYWHTFGQGLQRARFGAQAITDQAHRAYLQGTGAALQGYMGGLRGVMPEGMEA
jgi:hypothetical protein